MAALRVLGPSSAWFLIALASMSLASSSRAFAWSALGDVGGEVRKVRYPLHAWDAHVGFYSPCIEECDTRQRGNFLIRSDPFHYSSASGMHEPLWQANVGGPGGAICCVSK